LYQLLDSDKISRSFKWSFDASIGFKTGMQNVHRALPPRGVFVQYSNLVENGRAFIIYVCDTVRCQLHACMQVFNLDYST
jgi:hypothetical protein